LLASVASYLRALTILTFVFGARTGHCETKLFVSLDYQTAPTLTGCPDSAAFAAMVRGQLGYDPFRSEAQYHVVARAGASEQRITGSLRWYDEAGTPRGEREFGSRSDCGALVRAMSFAMTVQIQLLAENEARPAGGNRESTNGSSPETAEPAAVPGPAKLPAQKRAPEEPELEVSPNVERSSAHETSAEWQWRAGVGPTVAVGLVPGTALGGRLFAAIHRGNWGVELGLDTGLPSRETTADGEEGYERRYAGGSLAACGSLKPFSVCAVNRWGRLSVQGFGVDDPRSAAGTSVQFGPRFVMGGEFSRGWIAALRGEVLFAVIPLRVTLNQREIWEMPALSMSIGADLAAVFRDNP